MHRFSKSKNQLPAGLDTVMMDGPRTDFLRDDQSVHSARSARSARSAYSVKSLPAAKITQRPHFSSSGSVRSMHTSPTPAAIHFPGLEQAPAVPKKKRGGGLAKALSSRFGRKKKDDMSHDQVINDFFDVQSFASNEPSLAPSENPNLHDEIAPRRFRLFAGLSSRSVTSTRSAGSRRGRSRRGRNNNAVSSAVSLHDADSVSSWNTASTDNTPRFLIRVEGNMPGGSDDYYQDDDEITLGSAFSENPRPRRGGMDRMLSENWTANSRGLDSAQGKKKKKKKGLMKTVFRMFRSKAKKKKDREERQRQAEQDALPSPTRDMDMSVTSFDFESELNEMKARYNQEMSSRGSFSSHGSDGMPNAIDIHIADGASRSGSVSEDGKEEVEITRTKKDDDETSVVSLLTGLLKTWNSERELVKNSGGRATTEAEEKEEEVVLGGPNGPKPKGCLKDGRKRYPKHQFTVAFSVV